MMGPLAKLLVAAVAVLLALGWAPSRRNEVPASAVAERPPQYAAPPHLAAGFAAWPRRWTRRVPRSGDFYAEELRLAVYRWAPEDEEEEGATADDEVATQNDAAAAGDDDGDDGDLPLRTHVDADEREDDDGTPEDDALRRPVSPRARGIVVLCHGYGDHMAGNAHVARELARAGFVVLGMDIEGHGRSSGVPGFVESFARSADDILAFVRAEARREAVAQGLAAADDEDDDGTAKLDVFVAGESMGGLLSVLLLQAAPDLFDGGILFAPAVQVDPNMYPLLRNLAHAANRVVPALAIAPGLSEENGMKGLNNDPNVFHYFREDPLTYHGRLPVRTGVSFLDAFENIESTRANIRAPVLIMQGSGDTIVRSEAVQEFYDAIASEDKQLLILDGEVHNFIRDPNWRQHVNTVKDWINKHLTKK